MGCRVQAGRAAAGLGLRHGVDGPSRAGLGAAWLASWRKGGALVIAAFALGLVVSIVLHELATLRGTR